MTHEVPPQLRLPAPTDPLDSRADVFLGYLDYFRARVLTKLAELPAEQLRLSRLPSGWTPLELLKHLTFVELRWFEWGFEGRTVADPWGDRLGEHWQVAAEEDLEVLAARAAGQAARTREIVRAHDLADVGRPGPRWDGAAPPTLERVLFHVLQEYARHLGHLDIVAELAAGRVGE